MKILSFGEIIWDVYDSGPVIGGAPLNFAANCAYFGEDAYMLSAVGNDELGDRSFESLEKFGVKTEYIARNGRPTGYCSVTLDERAVPHYEIADDVAYDHISADKNIDGADFDLLYFGTLAQRSEQNRNTLKELLSRGFGCVFCDVNIRAPFFDEERLALCLKSADVLKISREELKTFTKAVLGQGVTDIETAAKRLCAAAPQIKVLIITLDSDGAAAYDAVKGKLYKEPCVKTKVVSTVGAGDGFSAAFICEYKKSGDIEKALGCAVKFAAKIVSVKDAVMVR